MINSTYKVYFMSRIDTGMFPFGNYILSGRIPPVEAIHFYKSHDKWTINGGGGEILAVDPIHYT